MPEFLQIQTTASSEAEADRIAERLVERRLAACVHVSGPIRSTYLWKGAVQSEREWTCTAKTRGVLFDRVAAAISEAHSYDCPEVIAVPIVRGSNAYLKWLDESLGEA
ncbi:divalent-cation tolerance protein CutA [Pirellulales bacterium]|nr:divalent-cation tolerance protein CutA [Pirellulales bacterium]